MENTFCTPGDSLSRENLYEDKLPSGLHHVSCSLKRLSMAGGEAPGPEVGGFAPGRNAGPSGSWHVIGVIPAHIPIRSEEVQ